MAGLVITMLGLVGTCGGVSEAAGGHPGGHPHGDGTIVALGDSLTAGFGVKEKEAYPARLEKKLAEAGYRWRVINAGVSGETSGDILSRIDDVLKVKPDIVILEIGVNDGFMGVAPYVIRANIEEILSILKTHGITVVLAGMRMFTNPGGDYGKAFAAIYPAMAHEHDIILIPFFLDGVAGDASLNKADGIHPVAKGYRVVVDTVYPYVLSAIERNRGK